MIELVEVHEPKVKIVFGKNRVTTMIDTDFEHQKQQGKDMIYPAIFKPTFSASPEVLAKSWEQAKKDFEAGQKRKKDFTKGGSTGNTKPQKPHWFERFLRWWYDL